LLPAFQPSGGLAKSPDGEAKLENVAGQGIRQSLAKEDGRSLANWLERLIEAEAARHDGKK
jgi:hypothetical protein